MILASTSPRRKEILENFGFSLKILTKDVEEISEEQIIENKIMNIAKKKAMSIAVDYQNENVVGADTVVIIDNKILGKPKNEKDAYNMLKNLSARTHKVITAFSYINLKENKIYTDFDITKVYFRELSDEDINWYIKTGEPFDKAGAYGIQGKGAFLVEKIEGDFFNVMGFPLGKFLRFLRKLKIGLNEIEKI